MGADWKEAAAGLTGGMQRERRKPCRLGLLHAGPRLRESGPNVGPSRCWVSYVMGLLGPKIGHKNGPQEKLELGPDFGPTLGLRP